MRRTSQTFDPKKFLATIGSGRVIALYKKGQNIFSQGSTADEVFYIQQGQVKVSVVNDQGREAVIALLGEDEFFGEGCLAGQTRRVDTATAINASEIMRISKRAMLRAIADQPAFSALFVAHVLARTARAQADLADQLFNSSEKRLARALLLLANFGKEGKPEPIVAKVSQEILAEMIGTTRSRVSFFMNKFRKLGFISYNGKLQVHNSLLSVVLADQPGVRRAGSRPRS